MLNIQSRGGLPAIVFALSASIASAAAASPPAAADVVVRVSYADLNIHAQPGAQALRHRIAKAAAKVCGGVPDSRLYDDKVRFERCRTEAYDRAATQLEPEAAVAGR
jgi:UrcA family protein